MDPALKVSRDASRVQFGAGRAGGNVARFVLFARELLPRPASGADLAGPNLDSPRFALERWRDSPSPTLNGLPLELDDYELAFVCASPDHRSSCSAPSGRYAHTTEAHRAVAAAAERRGRRWRPEGRTVVAALSDGTLRWLRTEDGAEYMALFPPGSGEWIAWTPQGYYVSSDAGDQYIGWHLNRGREGTPLFYRAVQFERLLYRPDIVDESFRQPRTQTDGRPPLRSRGSTSRSSP